jgi:predicted alpha-1,2-mannosidase
MGNIRHLCLTVSCLMAGICSGQAVSVLVNPLVGTASEGQTFPVAGVPFAMTDWTPQTRDGETKCIAPYYASDSRIEGFRGSHFLSGSCTQDYGSFTLMPVSGRLQLSANARASAFTHAGEQAHPAEYAVDLARYAIHAQITGTTRSGLMRFRYDRPGPAWLVVQTNSQTNLHPGRVDIDMAHNEISGENPVFRLYAGEGRPAGYSGYFVMQFDRPIVANGFWKSSTGQVAASRRDGAYVGFEVKPGESVQVRIGTSFTSIEEARLNLQAEIPDWDFARIASLAEASWEKILGSIQIAGSAPQRRIFYTALYHSFLLPRVASDLSGHYPRFGHGKTIETAKGFTYYDDFSLWDTFRATHPLFTILDPVRDGEMVSSLIAKGSDGGFLPIYPAWNSYTSEMIGDHANALIVDAYMKDIRNFNIEEAYRLMRRNAMETPSAWEYHDGRGRRALPSYLRYGYIPLQDHVLDAFHQNEQVSRTLEYAYDDFLLAALARALGKADDARVFSQRAGNWRNVIDPSDGFARGRNANGTWIDHFNPGVKASYITEGLPFQYTFFVPQDIPGLMDVIGGQKAFVDRLDTLFRKGYYDQSNEPSHHIAYLYDYAGAPWKTQEHVRRILDTDYLDRVDGLSGNDDCGQMSSWYVFSALGFYQVTPGVPEYALGSPRFDDIRIAFPGGHALHIVAKGTEAGRFYVRKVTFNGIVLDRPFLRHQDLVAGGELVFEMAATPSEKPLESNPLSTKAPIKQR